MSPLALLRDRLAKSVVALPGFAGDLSAVLELVQPSGDPRHGDYQANCAMPLGKQLGCPPREVAAELVAALDVADFCHPAEIAGPGFINFRLRDDWLAAILGRALADTTRLGVTAVEQPRTFVIDYSSPNVAKPMHVGHIRSTVIGDALYRVLDFLGHQVISDNHIGDWGTQFGMILYGYKHFVDGDALASEPVAELSRLYRLVNSLAEYHEQKRTGLPALAQRIALSRERVSELSAAAVADKGAAKKARQAESQLASLEAEYASTVAKQSAVERDPQLGKLAAAHPEIGSAVLAETALLHAGDATNRKLWNEFLPACLAEIDATYQRLGVTFDHALGESFYHDQLATVVDDLLDRGIATVSEGAVCVFLPGHEAPMIIRKKDGAYLYATTDLATIAYRLREWRPDAILYVVDHRQSLHFEQLFATARQCGCEQVDLVHVSFGTVLGEDGKPYKTRSGSAVGLMGLLDEAVERARAIANLSESLTTDAQRADVAEKIGIGAIKYADLAHNRTSDYVFSYDKMLAMTGNTAAYMQYSYARVRGIFAKADVDPQSLRAQPPSISLATPAERALGLSIVRFGEALDRVATDYRPNHLTSYLFEVASRYAEFFEQCPVLRAETDDLRLSRLALCDLTARVIEKGLGLLGIRCVERM